MKLDLISIGIIILIFSILYMTFDQTNASDIQNTINTIHLNNTNENFNDIYKNNQNNQNNQNNKNNNHKNNHNKNKLNKQNHKSTKKLKSVKKIKSAIKKQKRNKKKKVKFNIPLDKNKKTNLVFMDIGTDNKYYGKIIIRLFDDVVPKTCENFRVLCQTKKYYNSPFHRIIKDFMIQGGDFTQGNGKGGMSIYGSKFPDENFKINHDRPYLLSMANSGPNTNGSQFFITTSETPHLDGKHVVFGEIQDGFDVIDTLNLLKTDNNDSPYENVKILNCGLY